MSPVEPEGRRFTEKAIALFWGVCCAAVLVLDLFFSRAAYACKQELINEWVLLCLGLTGAGILIFAVLRIPGRRISWKLPALLGLVFLLLQLVAVRGYYFKTKWDVINLIKSAWQAARGEEITGYRFSRYPNNLLLTYVFSRILRVSSAIGLSDAHAYDMLLAFQCLICYMTGLSTFGAARELTGDDRLGALAYLFYLLLIGLSPWVSIPYTDACGILFPVTVLWLAVRKTRTAGGNVARWLAVGLLSWLGYKIKPTVMIVFLAVCLVNAAAFRAKEWRKRLPGAAAAIAGLMLGAVVMSFVVADFGYPLNKEEAFGPAHFLAMSLNEETMGYYSYDDVRYSASFKTVGERTRADLRLAGDRVQKMGVRRLSKQLARKLLTDYNDGSFAWTMEETERKLFFFEVTNTDSGFKLFIRSFYYDTGSRFALFINFETALWLAILSLSLLAAFSRPEKGPAILMLSTAGMFLYNLLFEARARYLYVFAPLYILLAVLGTRVVMGKREKPSPVGEETE